jgi:Rv0078B-related antitoxin
MHDTSEKAAALQAEILRKMTGEERLRLAFDMSETVRAFSTARLRHQHPEWSDIDLKRELLRYAFLPGSLPDARP